MTHLSPRVVIGLSGGEHKPPALQTQIAQAASLSRLAMGSNFGLAAIELATLAVGGVVTQAADEDILAETTAEKVVSAPAVQGHVPARLRSPGHDLVGSVSASYRRVSAAPPSDVLKVDGVRSDFWSVGAAVSEHSGRQIEEPLVRVAVGGEREPVCAVPAIESTVRSASVIDDVVAAVHVQH